MPRGVCSSGNKKLRLGRERNRREHEPKVQEEVLPERTIPPLQGEAILLQERDLALDGESGEGELYLRESPRERMTSIVSEFVLKRSLNRKFTDLNI